MRLYQKKKNVQFSQCQTAHQFSTGLWQGHDFTSRKERSTADKQKIERGQLISFGMFCVITYERFFDRLSRSHSACLQTLPLIDPSLCYINSPLCDKSRDHCRGQIICKINQRLGHIVRDNGVDLCRQDHGPAMAHSVGPIHNWKYVRAWIENLVTLSL
jgi:hypothetical protein